MNKYIIVLMLQCFDEVELDDEILIPAYCIVKEMQYQAIKENEIPLYKI